MEGVALNGLTLPDFDLRFEVLMSVKMPLLFFCVVTLLPRVGRYLRSEESYCFHLLALKMETVCLSERLLAACDLKRSRKPAEQRRHHEISQSASYLVTQLIDTFIQITIFCYGTVVRLLNPTA
jgi:hypothetical protein